MNKKENKNIINKILKNLKDPNYLPAMDESTRKVLISLIVENKRG
tara:strand:+ start:165 stop:299 length:135 start_codon:yes stop_codon:yes gene_type:complete